MQRVYNLVMTDTEASCDGHVEGFQIGFFSGRALAEQTAAAYLAGVRGFCDYRVTYRITEKRVIGAPECAVQPDVYIVYGWNVNEEQDETDVAESDCYFCRADAETKLREMQHSLQRTEWCIDKYKVDVCYWQDGFEKVYH